MLLDQNKCFDCDTYGHTGLKTIIDWVEKFRERN